MPPEKRPRHVAIIMDGNNRWARLHDAGQAGGHQTGVEAVRTTVSACAQAGVESLTLFAFSSENWQRPEGEVQALLTLFLQALAQEIEELDRNGIRVGFIGDTAAFEEALKASMEDAERRTRDNDRMRLNVAANYGGRWDLVQAAQRAAEDARAGRLDPATLDEAGFGSYLSMAEQPVPDLCIRTGGERRLSNFLLWHLAYAELYFTDLYWPDFGHEALEAAFRDFASRQRRFGRTSDQVEAASGRA